MYNKKIIKGKKASFVKKNTSSESRGFIPGANGKYLFLVEAPNKLKTIQKFLSGDFDLFASYGHIKHIKPRPSSVRLDNNQLEIDYECSPQYDILKSLLVKKQYECVYIATDNDREGEMIGYHAVELVSNCIPSALIKRASFIELSKGAVQDALCNTRELNMPLVKAALSRAAIDFLFGFKISPVLWKVLDGVKSAGRVQSPALALTLDREIQIQSFEKSKFYFARAIINIGEAEYSERSTKNILDKNIIQDILDKNKQPEIDIGSITSRLAPAVEPLTTTGLQKYFSIYAKWRAQKTMQVAQSLYEGIKTRSGEHIALISYIRTDSTNLSTSFLESAKEFLEQNGFKYEYKNITKSKSAVKAQEAHEAIRPSNIHIKPSDIKDDLNMDQYNLYSYIWHRTIYAISTPPKISSKNISITYSKDCSINLTSKWLSEPSTRLLQPHLIENPDPVILNCNNPKEISIKSITLDEGESKPVSRYSEGSLISALEKYGIGRPSTYANILGTLTDRGYVIVNKANKIVPSRRGAMLIGMMGKAFSEYIDYQFTASLEKKLESIAIGSLDYLEVLQDFNEKLDNNVLLAKKTHYPNEDFLRWYAQQISYDDTSKIAKISHASFIHYRDHLLFLSRAGKVISASPSYSRPVDMSSMLYQLFLHKKIGMLKITLKEILFNGNILPSIIACREFNRNLLLGTKASR
jgi:DNA topoisomerase-1